MAKKATKVIKSKLDIVEPKGIAMVPNDSKQISSDIDMKLSKQDIIDMLLEEAKEKLQLEYNEKEIKYQELRDKLNLYKNHQKTSLKSHFDKMKAILEKQYAKELAVVASHGNLTFETSYNSSRLLLVIGKGLMTESAYNELPYQRPPSYENMFLPSSLRVYNSAKKNDKVYITMELAVDFKDLKEIYADLETLANDLSVAKDELETACKNLQSVEGSAKKAKAQLVRNILESSSDGQSVLAGLSGMKQALLTKIVKN